MSDITPGTMILEVRNKFGELYVARDGITVLTEGDPCDEALIHGIVRAWNALVLAGITPEALARDPECVERLVSVADWIAGTAILVAQDHEKMMTSRGAIDDLKAALRACGIEVTT